MRAKFVNEEKMVNEPDIETMAFEIAQVVESTYNGDDVDYEPNEEDIQKLEDALKEYIFDLRIIEDVEDLSDQGWIIENLAEEEISEIYVSLVDAGFINSGDFDEEKMREDMFDPQEPRWQSHQPGDNPDLDQDIYSRNPDYDVD